MKFFLTLRIRNYIQRSNFFVCSSGLRNNQLGSSLLGLLLSVFGGLFFVLTFFQFVNYLSAKNAIKQAARAVSRCVTPTDPACLEITQTQTAVLEQNWYGSREETGTINFADRYLYSAKLYNDNYQLNYNTYQILSYVPELSYEKVTLPLRTYTANLNRWADQYGLASATFEKTVYGNFKPARNINFPPNAITDNLANHLSLSEMRTFQRQNGNGNGFLVDSSAGAKTVPANSIVRFRTDWITVPELDGASGANCFNANGSECSVATDAGSTFRPGDWAKYAYVAFIPMSLVDNPNSFGVDLAWRRPNLPGLEMEIRNKDGVVTDNLCLGGRRPSTMLARRQMWFNMDIRGPAGSNDGARGHCGGVGGLGDFSGIKVPRGGSFRIISFLENSGSGDLTVDVKYLYTWDDYNRESNVEKLTKECEVRFSTKTGVLCNQIDSASCGLDSSWGNATGCLNYAPTRFEHRCDYSPDSFDLSPNPSFPIEAKKWENVAVCSQNVNLPDNYFSSQISIPVGRKFCGVTTELVGQGEFLKPAGCGNIRSDKFTDHCSQLVEMGLQANLDPDCNNLKQEIVQLFDKTKDLSLPNHSGLPIFSSGSLTKGRDYKISNSGISKTKFSWAPGVNASNTETFAQNATKTIYRRADNSIPSLSEFGVVGEDGSLPPSNIAFSSQKIESTEESIKNVFPFSTESEFEISLEDSNGTCLSPAERSDKVIKEKLLEYASVSIPEVKTQNLQVDFSWQKVGSQAVSDSGLCGESGFIVSTPKCTPVYPSTYKLQCGLELIAGGPFNSTSFPNGPQSCIDGTYNYCQPVYVGNMTPTDGISVEIDENFAANVGYASLGRAIPSSLVDCQGVNCTSIQIDTSDPNYASVTVNYEMPILPFFGAFFVERSLPISYTKREVMQIKMASTTK